MKKFVSFRGRKMVFAFGVLVLGMMGMSGLAYGNDVIVYPGGTHYATIQAGVNACPVGGTVSVASGTYTEAVYVNKRIALIGAGSKTTTITASGLGYTNTVTFEGIATNGASISNFKITGAMGTMTGEGEGLDGTLGGRGITCHYATITITNNIISENYFCGIVCRFSSPTINYNIISGHGAPGIYCGSSSPTITNNTISGNGYGFGCDGIECNGNSSPAITNNTISGNGNAGIFCRDNSSPTIINNTISGNGFFLCENDPDFGDGIHCESPTSPSS